MSQAMFRMLLDPAVGEQIVKLLLRVDLGHARKHVAQVGERIDPQSLAGGDQRVEHRRRLAAAAAADEQPVDAA